MPPAIAGFGTTQWSVVLASGNSSNESRAALEQLCRTYWHPVYSHIRGLGNDPENSYDLTQAFFEDLLARDGLSKADPTRGRFRSFLCGAIRNFLHRRHRDANAKKRGGGSTLVSIDAEEAESVFQAELRTDLAPDRAYDRNCARALIDTAFAKLRAELDAQGRGTDFDRLRSRLWMDSDTTGYEQLASEMGVNPNTLRVTVMRLRARFSELLVELVAQTVEDPNDVRGELRCLIEAFDS